MACFKLLYVGGVVMVYFYYKVVKHKTVGLPSMGRQVGAVGRSSVLAIQTTHLKARFLICKYNTQTSQVYFIYLSMHTSAELSNQTLCKLGLTKVANTIYCTVILIFNISLWTFSLFCGSLSRSPIAAVIFHYCWKKPPLSPNRSIKKFAFAKQVNFLYCGQIAGDIWMDD